jgi:hypothetical protein
MNFVAFAQTPAGAGAPICKLMAAAMKAVIFPPDGLNGSCARIASGLNRKRLKELER